MRQDYYANSKDYINRWVISYADFVTMLLALFLVLFALSSMEANKLQEAKVQIEQRFQDAKTIQEKENQKIINDLNQAAQEGNFANEVKFISTERGVIIRINNNTLFDEGSAIIKVDARSTLNKVAEYLKTIDNKIIIEGHTDSKPIKTDKYESNWELSTIRATNMIQYLVTKYGISPQRLSALGYGEFTPLESNKTEKGREQNRRVDIVILNSKQTL